MTSYQRYTRIQTTQKNDDLKINGYNTFINICMSMTLQVSIDWEKIRAKIVAEEEKETQN